MREPIDRWKACLHEAGHLCAARALNIWDMPCRATIFEDGGGFYMSPVGLKPGFKSRLATAAGAYAELLAQRMAIPKTRPKAVEIRQQRPRTQERVSDELLYADVCETWSDGTSILDWVLKGHEWEPIHELKFRLNNLCDQAEELVEDHRREIRRVAETLYHDGEIRFEGDPEHKLYFERINENARRKKSEDKGDNNRSGQDAAAKVQDNSDNKGVNHD